MSKAYPIERSPLYRMRNRSKLAELLCLPKDYFTHGHEHIYTKFSRPKPNGDGVRKFTVPQGELEIIQKRVYRLLSRIETPDWVMSGKKHRSYITNAKKHVESSFVKTMDISQFYDSVQKGYIYKMFNDTFMMADDIAWIMTDLVTCEEALPTGSPTSQLIIYWTYSKMFDLINNIALKYNCLFTLYVDDMTFSANIPISKELRDEVAAVLKKNGLKAKAKKDHYYQTNAFKVITGVGISKKQMAVPNNKRKKVLDQYKKCKGNHNLSDIEKLRGMLCAVRQIEPEIFPEVHNFVKHYNSELAKYARNRYYKNQRLRRKATENICSISG